ncbi:hypothetical protein [Nostoc sp.]|uniref:hypothetical protein n=1 Tax=Nostoc sp. TaxID=1180 RepID=UPI003FA556A8
MINQHLQAATLKTEVSTAMPSASFANAELQEFIATCRDAREARKALAVKLIYQDYLYAILRTIFS